MRVIVCARQAATDERGGVLVMVAVWLPVLIVLMTFVIDMANWFEHKRHLQMQADSGALAAMQEVRFSCDDAEIGDVIARYSGTEFNAQIGGTPASRVARLVNSNTFHGQSATVKPATPDDTIQAPVCDASMIDVKLTETDLPWFFPPFAKLWEGLPFGPEDVSFINARARVSFLRQDTAQGALPVGVPDVNPRTARAWFVNEATGAVLGSTSLTAVGNSSGLSVWDNADAPLPVKFDSGDVRVGVVVAFGGATSTTCGEPLVECFDAGATTLASGLPSKGIVHVRGWSAAGSGAQPGAPILREATLLPGQCADPYFSSSPTTCRFGVRARVDFGPVSDPVAAVGATVTARVGNTSYPLAYDAAAGDWAVDAAIPLAPGAGPVDVTLDWAETKGTWNGNGCTTSGGNKCKDSFGVVQRAFAATGARSGPIEVAQVWRDGLQWANAVERCSSAQESCTHDMVVRIGIKGSLGNASSVNDPIVSLRVVGGSQNQSLDCDRDKTMVDELATGCAPSYARNTGSSCPASPNTLWGSPQPWPCVAVQTGSAVNQVPKGLNLRILGAEKPSACTSPNRWADFPDLDPADPRLIQVLLTPYGAFGGNGSTTVPVTDFATFYVTGWTGSGQGFANPCQGNGDDPVPNNDAGYIVGHFVKYIQSLNPPGTGSAPCDMDAFGSCIAELTH
jgi:Flp pilus assembly protein TadG